MINRKNFFAIVRSLHHGILNQNQVDGYTFILDVWEQKHDDLPKDYLAYALATAYHETAATMQPVVEYGPKSYFQKYDIGKLAKALGNTTALDGDGYLLRGRGYVQLTGHRNYVYAGQQLGIDLRGNPELATDPHIAAQIMFAGMLGGWFTGKKLKDYMVKGVFQKVNARRIINGTDKAVKIAGHFDVFKKALT